MKIMSTMVKITMVRRLLVIGEIWMIMTVMLIVVIVDSGDIDNDETDDDLGTHVGTDPVLHW